MTRKTKLFLGIAALAIAGGVAARTIFFPPTNSTPIKATPQLGATTFDHQHQALDEILRQQVRDERVDYAALKASPEALSAYLGQLAAVEEAEFNSWTENQQLAMLINLYNAATLKLVIDHYPLDSIKDIGGLFKQPWDIKSLTLFGDEITLDHLEHEILRKQYDEPRIHFAIVCAAKGCPGLRPGAFSADHLDAQLNQQGVIFLRDENKNRVDVAKKTIYLSKIFSWFDEDFENGGSVIDFVKPYLSTADAEALDNQFKIKYTRYDWSLNEQ